MSPLKPKRARKGTYVGKGTWGHREAEFSEGSEVETYRMVYLAIESTDLDSNDIRMLVVDLPASASKTPYCGFSEMRPEEIFYEFDTTIVSEEEPFSNTGSIASSTDADSTWPAVSDASSAPSEMGRPHSTQTLMPANSLFTLSSSNP
ncbi:MAG: hypothetical protein MMC33_008032 [Icmadophila ericetorum]|nr:hypothetical protein [Icmadophila ericetorum]